MKYEVSAGCCRICLTKSKKQRSLYKPIDDGDEPPNEMLQKVTGITVEEMEKFTMLPKNICKNCELSLSMAFEFREKVLQSQEAIVAYMQELQIPYPEEVIESETKAKEKKQTENKKEPSVVPIVKKDLDDSCEGEQPNIHILENHSDSMNAHQQLEEIPEQEENDYDPQLHGTEEFTEETLDDDVETYDLDEQEEHMDVYNNGEEEEEDHQQHQQQYVELDTEDENVINLENDDEYEEIEDDDEMHQQMDNEEFHQEFLEEKENNKIEWRLEHEIEIDTESDPNNDKMKKISRRGRKSNKFAKKVSYICDICGNVYDKRGRMMEHRQRHEKQLKYACELCDAKFHLRELLRKHMYSHSGGKPLKCQYCSRTFYYESVRKAHEAVHEGLKPYVCDVCGKAFSYSHSLKKHKLIHAEVKLYRCEYCNKDFRLQHHMKQHNMTRLHRKAVALAEGHYVPDNNNTPLKVDNEEEFTETVLMEDGEIEQGVVS